MIDMQYPEGATPLDCDKIAGLKLPHVQTREQLDELELINIESGMRWLKKQKNIYCFDESFLRMLHKKLFSEVWSWAGTYRKTEKNIGIDPIEISVQVKNLLEDIKFWFENKVYVPVEAAVRFHHRLVYIHPFPNGNGRHARIMANAILNKAYKVEEINWAGEYDMQKINQRRKEYIIALKAADKGDFEKLMRIART